MVGVDQGAKERRTHERRHPAEPEDRGRTGHTLSNAQQTRPDHSDDDRTSERARVDLQRTEPEEQCRGGGGQPCRSGSRQQCEGVVLGADQREVVVQQRRDPRLEQRPPLRTHRHQPEHRHCQRSKTDEPAPPRRRRASLSLPGQGASQHHRQAPQCASLEVVDCSICER